MKIVHDALKDIPHKKLCVYPGCSGSMELVRWYSKKTGDYLVNYVCTEEGWKHTRPVKDKLGRRVVVD